MAKINNKYDHVKIITVAKVASSDFYHSLRYIYDVHHGHSLQTLRDVLKMPNNLIIVGIRNPLDRNISYAFHGYWTEGLNNFHTKRNNYLGEPTYICPQGTINDMPTDDIIQKFFEHKYHFTFNDWFNEFFHLTDLYKTTFNKEKGLQFYDLPNNNCLMIYTLEKLNDNHDEICQFLGIKKLLHTNNHEDRHYKDKYIDFKNKITFTKEHKDKLLNTKIMKFFYSTEDIEKFYDKYPTDQALKSS